ncbi:hypothetical protein NL485_28565, partial [Klebsiella pneumoniae]|nr:hypothetical protein [Klebsiella pneumoniae]
QKESLYFRPHTHLTEQHINVNPSPARKNPRFFLHKQQAHRSGPSSYHHFLLGVVTGASR